MTAGEINHIALVLLGFFAAVALVLLAAPYLSRTGRQQRRALAARLKEIRDERQARTVLRVEARGTDLPERLMALLGPRTSEVLVRLHQRADAVDGAADTLLRCAGLALAGVIVGCLLHGLSIGVLLGLLAGALPLLQLTLRGRRRHLRFNQQFGQVLEFLARSMRSGLDLPGAMRMACEEFPDPVASEFRRAVDEISYGMPVEAAIDHIDQRVDCRDLAYLSACVSIQRETGGGLAQSLETLARAIRERRLFEGKVRALSAQGRLSAGILCILPLLVLAVMMLINSAYVSVLVETPAGNRLLAGALGLTLAGMAWVAVLVRVRI
jgi:tight adherence protein B